MAAIPTVYIVPIVLTLVTGIGWLSATFFSRTLVVTWPVVASSHLVTLTCGMAVLTVDRPMVPWYLLAIGLFGIATIAAAIRRIRRTPDEQRAACGVWR